MSMALAEPDEDEDEEEVETLELDSEPDFWSMTIWVHQAGGATKDVGAADASPSRVETVNSLAGKLKLVFHLILSLFALMRWSSIAALSLASKTLVLTAGDTTLKRSRSAVSKAISDCESLVNSNIYFAAAILAEELIPPISPSKTDIFAF